MSLKYRREYYQKNRERILEDKKIYHQENKERVLERNKKYRNKNKEKLCEVIECECGSKYQYKARSDHKKTQKHNIFDFFKDIEKKGDKIYDKIITT